MKKIFILTVLLMMTSCSKKESGTPTSLKLLSSAITAGLSSDGGAIITGKSTSGESFQMGLQVGDEATDINLTPGDWQFAAITWQNESGYGPLTGTNRCALTSATIEGEEIEIDLNLSPSTCSDSFFTTSDNVDGNQFNNLKLVACKNFYGIADQSSSCSTNSFLQGNNLSYRIYFKGMDLATGISLPSLASACISSTDLKVSEYVTNYKLPLNSNGNFPFAIVAYEDLNCDPDEQEVEYIFQAELIPGIKVAESLIFGDPASQQTTFFFPDNYIGTGSNTFANSGMLPPYQNLAYRYDDPTSSSSGGDNYQNTRDEFINILGTKNLTSPWKLGSLGKLISSQEDSNGAFLDISTTINTDQYNGMIFNFVDNGETCPVTTTFSSSPQSITVSYCTNTEAAPIITTTDDIVNAINTELSTNGLASSLVATNSRPAVDLVPPLSSSSLFITNGNTEESQSRRNTGLYGEIAEAFYGHLGAILFKAGFETCSEIPSSGSFSYDVGDGEVVEFKFSTGKIPMAEWMTSSGTYPQRNIFEKRVAFYEEGSMQEFYEFNCTGNILAGFYRSDDTDDSEDYRVEAYYDAQDSNKLSFETTKYYNGSNSGQTSINKQWSFLQNDQDSQEVKLWMARYYWDVTNSNQYGDIYASRINATNIYTSAKHYDQAALNPGAIDFELGTDNHSKYEYDGTYVIDSGYQVAPTNQPSTLAINSLNFPKLMNAIPTHMAPMTMNDSRLFSGFGPYVTYQAYKRTMDYFDDWNYVNSQTGCFATEATSEAFILAPASSLFTNSVNYLYSNTYSSLYDMPLSPLVTTTCSTMEWSTNFDEISIDEFSFLNYDGSTSLTSYEYLDEGTTFDFTATVDYNGSPTVFSDTLVTTNESSGGGQNQGNLRLFGNQLIATIAIGTMPTVQAATIMDFTVTAAGVTPGTTIVASSTGTSNPTCSFDLLYVSFTCAEPGDQVAGDVWTLTINNSITGNTISETITVTP